MDLKQGQGILRKVEKIDIEESEMLIWYRMINIRWQDANNEKILRRIKENVKCD